MSIEIEKRRANRYRILKAVYDYTGGDPKKWVDVRALCAQIGAVQAEFPALFAYLAQTGLLKLYGAGHTAFITIEGVKAIETAILHPQGATQFFPAVEDIDPGGFTPKY